MILLDTTVLVYAVGAAHELRDPCRRLIGAIADGEIEAGTTVEVIQEFAHVRARRRGRADATGLATQYCDLLSPLVEVTEHSVRGGLQLFAERDALGAFDAVLASVAASRSIRALVSADRAFANIPGLAHVYPDERGISELLAAR